MDVSKMILPGTRTGIVTIPASKSRAQRLLIMAALSDTPTTLKCNGFSNDILSTISCLKALGCKIATENDCLIHVEPLKHVNDQPLINLPCRDSGSTLRFLLALVGAMGADAVFEMEGRLPERPLSPYDSKLEAHGMKLKKDGAKLYCSGQLNPGIYTLPGNVSSQYISGLLMSLPLLDGDSELHITESIESSDYIRMTEDALKLANIDFSFDNRIYKIPGNQHYQLPAEVNVEGDWSSAAFFLCLGALSPEGIEVGGLNPDSLQGDKAIIDILRQFGADIDFPVRNTDSKNPNDAGNCSVHGSTDNPANNIIHVKYAPLSAITVDGSEIPDLIPVISVVAAAAKGTTHIINAGRLRLKESDRLQTTAELLKNLGVNVIEGSDDLVIEGCDFPNGLLTGGNVNSFGDHRIAMSAAVASAISREPIIVSDPECVKKSFANFWEVFDSVTAL